MLLFISLLACLSLFVPTVKGQALYLGACPDPPVEEVFEVEKFLGKWFEVERTFALFEAMLQCVSAEYYLREDSKIGIRNTGVDSIGREQTLNGYVITPDAYHPGRMIVFLSGIPIPANLTILHTDYKNFAVLWSCKELLGGLLGHTENMWILSRKPYLDESTKEVIYQFLVSTGVGLKGLKEVEQINCPHRKIPLPPIHHEEEEGLEEEAFLSRHQQRPGDHHDSVEHPVGNHDSVEPPVGNHDSEEDVPTYRDYRRKTGDLPAKESAKNSTRVSFDPRSLDGESRPQRQQSKPASSQRPKYRKQTVRKSRARLPSEIFNADGKNDRDRISFDETTKKNNEDKTTSESAPGYVRFRQLPYQKVFWG